MGTSNLEALVKLTYDSYDAFKQVRFDALLSFYFHYL